MDHEWTPISPVDICSMSAGGDWSTFNALSIWPRRDRASLYGSNDVAAGRPDLLRMVAAYLCQPIYIVQVCINWFWYAVYMLFINIGRQCSSNGIS